MMVIGASAVPRNGFHRDFDIPIQMKSKKSRKQDGGKGRKSSNIRTMQLPKGLLTRRCGPIFSHKESIEPVLTISADIVDALANLMARETRPINDPSSLYEIIPDEQDRVNGHMRDDAVKMLLELHKAYMDLSPEVFCQSVSIIDHFILRVKVKPKYMACVATAAYYLAAEMHEEAQNRPTPGKLVSLTRCGGTEEDLCRMAMIMRSKLGPGELYSATAMDYLKLFGLMAPGHSSVLSGESQKRVVNCLLVSLTSLMCLYEQAPSCLALATLCWESHADDNLQAFISQAASLCHLSYEKVLQCSATIKEIYDRFYQPGFPSCWEHLFWCLSRRTRCNLGSLKGIRQRATSLCPIFESVERGNVGGVEEEPVHYKPIRTLMEDAVNH